ncbi:hypothetical protein CIPAW_10G014200 [Carya illinoinensis]|uniref:Tropinone reductase-like 1 n=1 Tax=Carya illinoinensis TaxID=32201 RepID=A0A8T1P2V0_CARIL|nr:hypothetical protein CIPAW_10G014200 [Carya illinoinensis]
MAKRLDGKVAIITGGASGIGASAVQLFHEHGAKVVIADIQDKLGHDLADKIGENLDIMYSNAGIIDGVVSRILDCTKSDMERVLGVNLVGAFLCAKHAARVMIPQRKGCIIFTASATTAIAGISSHAYAASKCGLLGLCRNLAVELGQYGIRVNCVSPYAVVTGISGPMNEADSRNLEMALSDTSLLKGQVLKAESVAKAALYLASDDANYVCGLNLLVDGGYSVVNPVLMNFMNKQSGN